AKTGKQRMSLNKGDGSQLSAAVEWYKAERPERSAYGRPGIVANTTKTERDAYFPEGTKIPSEAALGTLLERAETVVRYLSARAPEAWNASDATQILREAKLTPGDAASLLQPLQ